MIPYRRSGSSASLLASVRSPRRYAIITTIMPELPEVETVRRGLLRRLPGQRIVRVQVHRTESVAVPTARTFASKLKEQKFLDVRRRGKYLLLDLDRGTLIVHLRMSGRLLILPQKQEDQDALQRKSDKGRMLTPYERIRFTLSRDLLIFDDMRVFGRAWFLPEGQSEDEISGIATLGPEPLEGLESDYLREKFAKKTQPIKTALLDQTIIAGIGNIYADEILHLSGIDPRRFASSLTIKELMRVADHSKQVLEQAIVAGGSSIRDYTNSDGVNGNYQAEAYVYGRKGQQCRQCKAAVERVKINGRSSHYCPRCQK
ncbi:MAG: bifunctional DNA-formamidopyrimidine glycosylase/DNA-(apurinic or apyrimidinic site) lyase [Candidatus Obscuribacterales bacterium]|nr:bifunctional DNA-formamidopyrimidine glycosylase/DNA-(apurinic or apyrimidinic site) lyase [Candidatus Obscuribacterales bacterium]